MAEMMPLRLTRREDLEPRFRHRDADRRGPRERRSAALKKNATQNVARWQKMPQIANYAVMGAPKPGAVVLMNVAEAGHRPTPLLAIQNYGHGRVGVFATAGSWRWKMLQDHTDRTHSMFWSQLLRWLVTETPGQVLASTPHQVLPDDTHVPLRVSVRDKNYETVSGSHGADDDRAAGWRFGRGGAEAGSAGAGHVYRRLYGG